ncbi:MAG: 4Fe-4S binding protein, partial [Clostridiales bacterium]|nr:4Fe-4S binding protein [Clostridiales bacterium]
MRIFDTAVQKLKYDVLKELIRNAYEHNIENIYVDIPKKISPGPKANLRCCVYKERAILQERIRMALGGDKTNPNIVEVVDIACDECPIGGVFVTPSCRGCIVHRCKEVCPRDAIAIIDKKAVIDKSKCVECGKCVKACPYSAIIEQRRPCISGCKVNAIKMDDRNKAVIDNDKCIACGACVYQCPFGAIVDKSLVMDVINILKASQSNRKY